MGEDCPHCVFEKTEANCPGCFEGSHYRPKPITNADRIRSMTDEELAEKIVRLVVDAFDQVVPEWKRKSDRDKANTALYGALPRWIPVTERCPEKSGDYLVFDDCRNLYVNEWHCLLKTWQYDDSRITHWMPLPTIPREDEE